MTTLSEVREHDAELVEHLCSYPCSECARDRRFLLAQLDEAVGLLRKDTDYIDHRQSCAKWVGKLECTCGLSKHDTLRDAFLQRLQEGRDE